MSNIFVVAGRPSTFLTYKSSWVYNEFYQGDTSILTSQAILNILGEAPYKNMKIVRNCNIRPPVSICGSLILRQDIAKLLAWVDSIVFVECHVEGYYATSVEEKSIVSICERFSWLDDSFYDWLRTQITTKPDLKLEASYVEVLAPRHELMRKLYDFHIECQLPDCGGSNGQTFRTCEEVHKQYPILEYGEFHLFSEEVFNALRKHITDTEIFTIKKVALS